MYELILSLASPKWRGPIFIAVGLFILVSQLLAWWVKGYLNSLLIGLGIGLPLVGAVAWFFYVDDANCGRPIARTRREEELPTADEYEQLLDAMDQVDHDHSK